MGVTITVEPSSAVSGSQQLPFPPSWIDRLLAWVEHLSVSPWLFYCAILALSIVINNGARWIDGTLAWGRFDLVRILEVPEVIYLIPFLHYLNRIATRSMAHFRPLLKLSDAEYARLEYGLTTLPRRQGWLALAIGASLTVVNILASPASWAILNADSVFLTIYYDLLAFGLMTLAAVFLLHTLNQLRMVSWLQRQPKQISLFQTGPVYAFSHLTSRTGIGIAILIYYFVFLTYGLKVYGPPPPIAPIDFVTFLVLFLTAAASFFIPLMGMHDRLVEEKSRAVFEVGERLERLRSRLHTRVDREDAGGGDALNKDFATLLQESQILEKVSTWPWKPETVRGFFGAITFPVLVWLITTVLGRILPV
jgi:hypothetical protein